IEARSGGQRKPRIPKAVRGLQYMEMWRTARAAFANRKIEGRTRPAAARRRRGSTQVLTKIVSMARGSGDAGRNKFSEDCVRYVCAPRRPGSLSCLFFVTLTLWPQRAEPAGTSPRSIHRTNDDEERTYELQTSGTYPAGRHARFIGMHRLVFGRRSRLLRFARLLSQILVSFGAAPEQSRGAAPLQCLVGRGCSP